MEQVAQSSSRPESVTVLPADLLEIETLPALVEQAWAIHGGLDMVILNAGIMQWDFVANTKLDVEDHLFQLNYWSPVATIKALLPKMNAQGFGRIMCVSSIAGHFGQKRLAAYSASKSALIVYLESLREEMLRQPVRIQVACPGVIKTPLFSRALMADGQAQGVEGSGGMEPEVLARRMRRFGESRRFLKNFTSPMEGLAVQLHRFVPNLFYALLRRRYADH